MIFKKFKTYTKFKEKSKEIISYEEKLLYLVEEHIKKHLPINTSREEVKFLVRLWWMNRNEEIIVNLEKLKFGRPIIKNGYMCFLEILFYDNENQINDYENEDNITLNFLISSVQKSPIIRRWEFILFSSNIIFESFNNYYQKIEANGYNDILRKK